MGHFVRAAAAIDIPEGKMKTFEIEQTRFIIAHTTAGFFAVADECSHDAGPIGQGRIRGNEVVCPRHGARFDLKTGAPTAPPAVAPIDSYRVKLENGELFVCLED
jgi:3-phenylpropionate/trans-cinnamate dioxygenase ferredoxin subunit